MFYCCSVATLLRFTSFDAIDEYAFCLWFRSQIPLLATGFAAENCCTVVAATATLRLFAAASPPLLVIYELLLLCYCPTWVATSETPLLAARAAFLPTCFL